MFDALRRANRLKWPSDALPGLGKSAITAEEGTSVLNVEFRDTNEELVLPIPEMISEAYQSYSNRGRARG